MDNDTKTNNRVKAVRLIAPYVIGALVGNFMCRVVYGLLLPIWMLAIIDVTAILLSMLPMFIIWLIYRRRR